MCKEGEHGVSKKYTKISVVILFIVLVVTNIFSFTSYKEIKNSETMTYSHLVNRFYNYGIMIPYGSIHNVNEKIKNASINQEDVTIWLNEIVSDMKVAAETSSIASNHWNLTIEDKNEHDSVSEVSRFYESIRMNLNDIIRTEKDYAVWKQACTDLEEILEIMKTNTNEQTLLEMDYKQIKAHWRELMELVREKHSDSRLLKSYFSMYYTRG